MKKAKLMLSAIAVFAVLGGTLAFKASGHFFTFYTDSTNGLCESQVVLQSTTDANGTFFPEYYTTTISTEACPGITLTADL